MAAYPASSARDAEMVRVLTPSEAKYFAPTKHYVAYTVQTNGELDWAALTAAFDALRVSYPVLAARLVTSASGVWLVKPLEAPSGVSRCVGDPRNPLQEVHPDQEVALGLLHVVQSEPNAAVTLLVHHGIADSHHGLALLARFWEFYTGYAESGTARPAPVAGGYPESPEALLAARGITGPAETAGLPTTWSDAPTKAFESLRVELSTEQTTALVELAHREQLTINGLVSAALLQAEAELVGVAIEEILYAYSVDLRARVAPPVEVTVGTIFLGTATYRARDVDATDLISLARDITMQLQDGLADGSLQRTALTSSEIFADMVSGGCVSASNWGRIPELPVPPELRLLSFGSACCYEPDAMAEVFGRGDQRVYIAHSFQDQLALVEHWLLSNTVTQSARRGLELTRQHLLALIR